MKRHMQQPDQGSLIRRDAIKDTRINIDDLEDALKQHKEEAAQAIKYHKDRVTGAAERYEELVALFHEVMSSVVTDQEREPNEQPTATDLLIDKASKGWFEVSSYYQQDKNVPS